jgi:hypothetical protein
MYRILAGLFTAGLVFAALAAAATSDRVDLGANEGWFHSDCFYSHSAQVDPIVNPGTASGHMHSFFGARSTNANSTNKTIQGPSTNAPGGRFLTTCVRTDTPWSDSDRSAYWVPTLYRGATPIESARVQAGYSQNLHDINSLEPFPDDLRVIVGDSTGQAPDFHVSCIGETLERANVAAGKFPTCADRLFMFLRFQDCWDGVNGDSADHKSHMAKSYLTRVEGVQVSACPASHPVAVPMLQLAFTFQVDGAPGSELRFSSGNLRTFHGDFMNGWDPDKLRALVDRCLGLGEYCGGGDDPVVGHGSGI